MSGTFLSVTGSSVSSVAQKIGSTEFLLPDGVMVPERGLPPLTMRSDIEASGVGSGEVGECILLRQGYGGFSLREKKASAGADAFELRALWRALAIFFARCFRSRRRPAGLPGAGRDRRRLRPGNGHGRPDDGG